MVDRSWAQTLGSYSASAHCSPSLRCQLWTCLLLPYEPQKIVRLCTPQKRWDTIPKITEVGHWTCSKMRMGQISQIARIHGSWSIQICYVFGETTRNHWGIPLCCPNGFAPKFGRKSLVISLIFWWDDWDDIHFLRCLSDFFVKSMDRAIPQMFLATFNWIPMGWTLPSRRHGT